MKWGPLSRSELQTNAIFLYEEMSPEGQATYNVVDGKQRLTTIYSFVDNEYPVSEKAELTTLRGKYFEQLDDDTKVSFWNYPFSVEYLPSADENQINSIFDRINRNVSKLSRQELRHARFDGVFITACEGMAELVEDELKGKFPRIAPRSRRQMKDVEYAAELLLFLENGPRNQTQDDLDDAFGERDEVWEERADIERRFRAVVSALRVIGEGDAGALVQRSRLRNQGDFYSLFGAVDQLMVEGALPEAEEIRNRLLCFVAAVEDADKREGFESTKQYFRDVRSAANDTGVRRRRIETLVNVLNGTDSAVVAG